MERREAEALDRHITGNYGEDQFSAGQWDEAWPFTPYEDYIEECQVSNCLDDAVDGVLCVKHLEQAGT